MTSPSRAPRARLQLLVVLFLSLPTLAWADGNRFGDRDVAVLEIAPPTQQLVASVGLQGALTGSSPGGMRVQGEYDRLLTGALSLDLHAAVVFGGNPRDCYYDRQMSFVCDHGATDGFALMVGGGVRYEFAGRQAFTPYLRGGAEVGRLSFDRDNVSGFALMLRGGGGVRWRASELIQILGEADLAFGVSSLDGPRKSVSNNTLGWLEVTFGVAFSL